MRRRSMSICVIGAACVLALAGSAGAQTFASLQSPPASTPAQTPPPAPAAPPTGARGDIEGGVALFNRVTNKGEDATYAPGWYVGGSYQLTEVIAIVGRLTADYNKDDGRTASIYTYAGGPRFQWKRADRVRPYFDVLFGGGQDNGVFAPSSDTNFYPMLAFGAGTDLAVSEKVIVRARFDVPILMKFSDSYVGTRVSVGIAVPLGSR